jgi:hypothetical protein
MGWGTNVTGSKITPDLRTINDVRQEMIISDPIGTKIRSKFMKEGTVIRRSRKDMTGTGTGKEHEPNDPRQTDRMPFHTKRVEEQGR